MNRDETLILDSEGNSIKPNNSLILKDIGDDLISKIITEEDPDELDKLTQLFTVNQKKKQIARTNKLSNLLDKVDDEVISRFNNNPEIIEDRDLLKYWSTTAEVISGKQEDNDIPKIQINNQTNISLNSSGLSRESRAKVLDVVNQILKDTGSNDDIIDVDVKEVDS